MRRISINMRESVFLVVFMVMLSLSAFDSESISEAGIVAAVQKNFQLSCVLLLQSNRDELVSTETVIILQRALFQQSIRTSIITEFDESETGRITCRATRRLHVVLEHSADWKRSRPFLQMVDNRKFRASTWLLFLDVKIRLEDFFSGINIPFDCQFLVAEKKNDDIIAVKEVYRVAQSLPLQMYDFGELNTSFISPSRSLFQRRNTLEGLELRTIPCRYKHMRNNIENIVWNTLQNQLRFISKICEAKDSHFGVPLGNGSWDGMVGMIQRNEVDITCRHLLTTSSRISVIDFLSTIKQMSFRLFLKEPTEHVVAWNEFLKPFSWQLWMTMIISMFLTSTSFILFDRIISRYYAKNEETANWNVTNASFNTFAIFCHQALAETIGSPSTRAILCTANIIAMVMTAGYSAFLISYLTTREIDVPFTSFKELLEMDNYKMGGLQHSAFPDMLKSSMDPVSKGLYKKYFEHYGHSLPKSIDEGLKRSCDQPDFVFVTLNNILAFREAPCKLMKIPRIYIPVSSSIIVTKNSPYKEILNYNILMLRSNGLLDRLERRQVMVASPSEPLFLEVDMTHLKAIFIFLCITYLFSIFILLCELVCFRISQKK